MKHGYRHLQGVRLCELSGCMLKWPCERHGVRVAWSAGTPYPRKIRVSSAEFPNEDVPLELAVVGGISAGTVHDKKCARCGYHVCDCRPQAGSPWVIAPRTSQGRP